MQAWRGFVPITKVDLERREVWGVLAEEVPDKANEILDFEKSQQFFVDWSAAFQKATEATGQEPSAGNLRAMHGNVVAGKFISVVPDPATKKVYVGAHVVDDNEWVKTRKGCYTGFSLGGAYVERWPDPVHKGVTRYIARPSEGSLVDNPCMYGATFSALKADGATELCKFVGLEAGLGKVAARDDTSPTEGEHKYGDVTFADPTNKKYPIDTVAHIKAAWNYINKPANAGKYSAKDAAAIKRRIIGAWKKRIDANGPPSAEKLALTATLTKNLYDVSQLAQLLATLDWLLQMAMSEAASEGDDSAVPARFAIAIQALGDVLVAMTAEEVGELTANSDPGAPLARYVRQLALEKAGRRNAKADQDRIQTVHDTSVALGASCGDETAKAAPGATAGGAAMEMDEATLTKALETHGAALTERLMKSIGESIAKGIGESPVIVALQKSVEEGGAKLTAVEARIAAQDEKLEELGKRVTGPGPAKGVLQPPVTKADENAAGGGDPAALPEGFEKLTADEQALALTKRSLGQPMLIDGRRSAA